MSVVTSSVAAISFVHPGIWDTKDQLRYVKSNLNKEPWKSAYEKILKNDLAKLDYKPTPWEEVECGSFSKPDFGCTDEARDASAAYTQAILWQLTGNTAYAENTRKILNAWADTLKSGYTNSNAPLQAAWSAVNFTRAAEILQYTYPYWSQEEKNKILRMFKEQYLPDISKMFVDNYSCYNHNWHTSEIEG